MTKQLTRQEVEAVVGRLADKTLSFGCMIVDKNHSPSKIMFVENGIGQTYSGIQIGAENTYNFFNGYMTPEMKVLGHPITIGIVLEKIKSRAVSENVLAEFNPNLASFKDIVYFWGLLGYDKSLQEIISVSGYEEKLLCGCEMSRLENGARGIPLNHVSKRHHSTKVSVLKSPEANALFSFLKEIL